jgi:hypothetical protein
LSREAEQTSESLSRGTSQPADTPAPEVVSDKTRREKLSSGNPEKEDWELDCEICGAKGINQVRHSGSS